MDVLDRALELILSLVRGVVRELRLVGADEVRGRIDDGLVELKDRRGLRGDAAREALDFRIEPDCGQRVVALPGARELLNESAHATRMRP